MQLTIIGTGYVGLVSGTCFAEMGNSVVCVDVNAEKVSSLRAGKTPIYEPGLEPLLARNIKEKRIRFTTSLTEGVEQAQIIFLALPTPPGADGAADLGFVLGVADELAKLITSYTVIVNKSTVPVGTAERVREVLLAGGLDENLFDVVSNPEFLREGVAVEDFLKPDRVVVGTQSSKAKELMEELYYPFLRQGNPIYFMDERSAEMTKYAANSYLAMRISFMNEIANLCARSGADVDHVRIGIGSDSRIGKRFLFPGVGYGGSCFPKDVQALHRTAQEFDYDFQILDSVMKVNQCQKGILAAQIRDYFGNNLSGKTIAVWGLAFKPETDDIREAPALELIRELVQAGVQVRAYDPEAMPHVQRIFANQQQVYFAKSLYDALEQADALAIVTEWAEFRNPNFEQVTRLMKWPAIFDGRNVYTLAKMERLNFYYQSIGRQTVHPELRPAFEPDTFVRSRGL
ncbi:MAG: UDP-glucose/GDP-mannose dehydrogenase family protein [Bacteroidetes bacterium]|nr:UDP-glucose/GDP-mannose dehydrogenase family protein [Bacteroidota bacterium]